MRPLPSLAEAVVSGRTADIYFHHTKAILEAEGLNPSVVMEVFGSRAGLLCGMKEVLSLLGQVLPTTSRAWALAEGESFDAREVVLRVESPYAALAVFETAILGVLAHESGWATAARELVEAAGELPMISFGARHVHPEVAARMEYAAVVGGCSGCSTPAGAELAGIAPSRTIPHALILVFGDTVAALQAFDRHVPEEVPRIALVDTFKDEAEESLRVAEALGDRLWGVRLDTPPERGGVTPDLVKEIRARLDQAGHSEVRIFVSGGVTPDRIAAFRQAAAPVDGFGVGSAISSASPIDFTADLKAVEGVPRAKRGRIPGPTHNPRLREVEL